MKLTATSLVLASVVLLPFASQAQEVKGPKINWNISVWGNPRAFTAGLELISKEIVAKTGGAFTIKTVYGNVLSPERENLDNIKIGSIDGAFVCFSYHPGKNPGMTVLNLPFLPIPTFKIQETVAEALYHHPFIVAEMKKWNGYPYMAAILPHSEFVGMGDPPMTIEDWKGKRVRAIGGIGDAMRILGSIPTTVTAPELYTSMDRAMVDAAAVPFSYSVAAFKLQEVGKWYTTNLAPGASNCGVVLSLTSLNKLPPQYRALLDSLKPDGYSALQAAYKEADDKNIPIFNKTLKPITYSDAELNRFHEVAGKPLWNEWVKENAVKGVPAQELLDLILTAAKK